jgi:hypothetical protein
MVLGVMLGSPAYGQAKPRPGFQRQAPNLFAGYSFGVLQTNRVLCLADSYGGICRSSESAGAYWPWPAVDSYIFQSGLQIAGIVSPAAGFVWAGDTVGAYFVDLRGTQEHVDALTATFDSRRPEDLAQWPNGAIVRDTGVFAPSLIGRNTVAEQDLWARYWEGDPAFLNGRTHPMGVLVEQRVLAWNFPSGNEDIFYVVATLTNVTARDPAVYANATIPSAVQGEIAAIGAQFQQLNETQLSVAIPDGGYALEQLYLGLAMEHDVAVFADNYASISLPFRTAFGYSGRFEPEAGWTFPFEVFGAAPFAALPGLIGTRFLRAPADLAMFSEFTGTPSGHPDPLGVNQLWRYLSGYLGSSDPPCNVSTDPAVVRARKVCFVKGFQSDDRYSQSIGPFTLAPGESRTVVLGYLFAAPLDTATAYAGGDLPPGFPFPGDSIYQDTTKIRTIERIAGWRAQADTNGNGIIEDDEVDVAPRSLLHKARLAQAMVDHKFQMPEAPAQPQFFLIPGDHRVTVVWQPSSSETAGDPYFPIAADLTSAAYDPNYRQFDVEGYRLYRGFSPNGLQLVAEFDYLGTQVVDFTGAFHYSGQCAPEIGVNAGCPVAFGTTPDPAVFVEHELVGRVIQVPAGGRIVTSTGALAVLRADTVILQDTGVPFAFVDSGLTNSFPLYYAVTAFDLNSLRSGRSSLESPRLVKTVTPRIAADQETGGQFGIELLGGDGTTLDPAAPLPALDPSTATFSGPMPPTNGFQVTVPVFTPATLNGGTVMVSIDSIQPGHANTDASPGGSYRPALYFLSVAGPTETTAVTLPLKIDGFSSAVAKEYPLPILPLDQSKVVRFGADSTFQLFAGLHLGASGTWRLTNWGRGDVNADPSRSAENGPRWWAGGANESMPRPNQSVCNPAVGNCERRDTFPNFFTNNAGAIVGVDIFHPSSYLTVNSAPMRDIEAVGAGVTRAADFRVHWGTNGAVDSVIDVTHHLAVPFKPTLRASWGILNAASFAGTLEASTRDSNNALLTWSDVACVDPIPQLVGICGADSVTPAVLQNQAVLNPISLQAHPYAATGTATQTGLGFVFYLNGHFFLMQAAQLPSAGSVWHARFYAGRIRASTSGTTWSFTGTTRPPAVPGLRARLTIEGSTYNPLAITDSQLARIHTVPDPLYVASAYQTSPDTAVLRFVNLPSQAIIRIYSTSGVLVAVLPHNDPTDGGEAVWNLRNRNGRWVASGVYFYHVETPAGRVRVGRFTVITYKP